MIRKNSIRLIFPPQFEPFQPYLSLPYIKGLLKNYGFDSTCFDANVDFYWWLFNKSKNEKIQFSPRKKYLCSYVMRAIEIIKSIPRNLLEYRWAINVVDEYLKAVSPAGVKISLTSLTIGNKYSSEDLLKYLKSNDNIFKEYFEHSEINILGSSNVKLYIFSLVVLDQLGAALTLAKEIKNRRPNAKVIVGGPLISRLYQRIIKVPWIHEIFDIISPGEAYLTLPNILGLKYKWKGHVTPDFSDFDFKQYLSCFLVLPYVVAHGCKWGRCTFCSHHLTYKDYRASNIEDVINDLGMLSKKYGVKYISFSDEYLTVKQLERLADLININKLDIRWSTFVRAESKFADENFTKKLYNSGCRMLMFGFESASQKILNLMKKGTLVKYYTPILRSCKNANISVRLDFMIGFPGETEKDIEQTFLFIKNNSNVIDSPFSSYAVAVFELREGIPVMDNSEEYGIKPIALLRGDLDEQYEFIEKSGLTTHQKKEWRYKMIKYSKNELNADIITPQNKTHQLLFKDLYDRGYFNLPVTKIEPIQFQSLWGKWGHGIIVNKKDSHIQIRNYTNDGELEIAIELFDVIEAFRYGSNLADAFLLSKIGEPSIFAKMINFFYRNDYLLVVNEKRTLLEIIEKVAHKMM